MHVNEAIVGRQSIREFDTSKDVSNEVIENILAVAGRSPSGSNIQPWKVWVVRDEAKQAISKACYERHMSADLGEREYNYYPVNWREPYINRRRATGWGLYGVLGIKRENKEEMQLQHGRNYTFFDAPVGMFFTIDRDMELGSWIDCGMFIQSVMLAARAQGLETCSQAAFCNYYDTVMHLLGAPDDQMLICGMSIGYAVSESLVNTFRTEREPVSTYTTFLTKPNQV